MNRELYKVDQLFLSGAIRMTKAVRMWRQIRSGMSYECSLDALSREEKNCMKNERKALGEKRRGEKGLEELLSTMESRVQDALTMDILLSLSDASLGSVESEDAMDYVSDVSPELAEALLGKDDNMDCCYSNTSGVEVLFY